jgi:hypothetical protein
MAKSIKKLPTVKITATRLSKAQPQSVTRSGQVPTSKIDSIRKANPAASQQMGKPYKGAGGMSTYGDRGSDVIKGALKKK